MKHCRRPGLTGLARRRPPFKPAHSGPLLGKLTRVAISTTPSCLLADLRRGACVRLLSSTSRAKCSIDRCAALGLMLAPEQAALPPSSIRTSFAHQISIINAARVAKISAPIKITA